MKILFNLTVCMLFMYGVIIPQQASNYFPANTGFNWYYVVTPLDSANNEIDPLKYYRADSFAVVADYKGMLANIIFSKSGYLNTIPAQPYSDSLFYHFEDANAFEYAQTGNMEFLLRSLDSLSIDPNFSFLDFFNSLENWYSLYRFGQPVQNDYTILSIDTTLQAGVLTLPLRFEYLGERLADETINTQIGSFNCKKFIIKKSVSIVITPSYLIPIAIIDDTVWIAPDNWIVKSFSPSSYVDMSMLGVDPLFVPGLKTNIIESITDVKEDSEMPLDYYLSQNYPNPFNPITNIEFRITDFEFVKLTVFDVLGNEVTTIINEEMPAGIHLVNFDASDISSGTYFYRLQAGDFIEIKKMIFLK